MAKVYVASSWKNPHHPGMVDALRVNGHQVYDYRNPKEGDNGFSWSEIDPNWPDWNRDEYLKALTHQAAFRGFSNDYNAMKWADTFVVIGPVGVSASWECGWAVGRGKYTVLYLPEALRDPDLMLGGVHMICTLQQDVINELRPTNATAILRRRYQQPYIYRGHLQAEMLAEAEAEFTAVGLGTPLDS